jgi:16S rRNA (uracil1498-N3)-methyltransferase
VPDGGPPGPDGAPLPPDVAPPPPDDARHPASAGAAALVYVSDLEQPVPEADDAHHLSRVLRLRTGQAVVAADGQGSWRLCRYRASPDRAGGNQAGRDQAGRDQAGRGPAARDPGSGSLDPDGPVTFLPPSEPAVTIGFVPVKGERPEWVVQKLTEAGVDRIAVLRSQRAVVRWEGERGARSLERLGRVAREAGAQSRRPRLPEVVGVLDLAGLARLVAPAALALAHPGGDPPSVTVPAMAIGPEGGWEISEILSGSYPVVGLGPGILRAETAAVAGGLLLCALRAGIVGEVNRPSTGSDRGR